ncbi:hypothetical protein TorRG33x02_320880, partial [Trema orientale]
CQIGLPAHTPTQDRIKCPVRVWRRTSSHALLCGRPFRLPTPSCRGRGRTGRARLSSQMGLTLSLDNWAGLEMPHAGHVTAKWFSRNCLKDELEIVCALARKFLGRLISTLATSTMTPPLPSLASELGVGSNGFDELNTVATIMTDFGIWSNTLPDLSPCLGSHRL